MEKKVRMVLMIQSFDRIVARGPDGFVVLEDKNTGDYVQSMNLTPDFWGPESKHTLLPLSWDLSLPVARFEVRVRGVEYLEPGYVGKNLLAPQQIDAIAARGFGRQPDPNHSCAIDLVNIEDIANEWNTCFRFWGLYLHLT